MNTWPSIIRANDASTHAMFFRMSAATAAIVGICPRVLIARAIATRTSRSSSASVIRDVFHEVELVVPGGTDVAHASLLHHAARGHVLREADGDDLAQPELAETVVETGARGFRCEAASPPLLGEVVRDLDLRTLALDIHEAAVTDELTGRAQLDRPETEAVLSLVADEAHRLVVAEDALVEHFGVADLERADDQTRRFDRERQRVPNAIGRGLGGHGALSIGSSARSARSAAGHANQWRDTTAPVVSS